MQSYVEKVLQTTTLYHHSVSVKEKIVQWMHILGGFFV